ERMRCNAERLRNGESGSLWLVADDRTYLDRQAPVARALGNRAHVAAPAGDEDDDRKRDPRRCRLRVASLRRHRRMVTPPSPRRTSPMMTGCSPCSRRHCMALSVCSAATQIVMPIPQLNVRYISASEMLPVFCNQSNTGGRCQV